MFKKIRLERNLQAKDIELGKGAVVSLENASSPIIRFLRDRHLEEPSCISGDIEFLYKCSGTGLDAHHKYYES